MIGYVVLIAAIGGGQPAGEPARPTMAATPFFRLRAHQLQYHGPGREEPEPAGVTEVAVGYFGPADPADPAGDMWLAAQMAVEMANRSGGWHGKPFRLVPAWSENPWGTGVGRLVRAVYDEHVWAIVGGVDSASTHLAEQVVAKARLVLVSPACGDKTANLAGVPWIFSCLPGDHIQVPPLAAAIAGRHEHPRLVVLVAADQHDARLFERELVAGLSRSGSAPRFRFAFSSRRASSDDLIRRVLESRPAAVAVAARAHPAAQLVRALRENGFAGRIFGGMWMGRRRFLAEAGAAAEGCVFPLVWERGPSAEEFVRLFQERTGREPDYAAAHAFDAVNIVLAAIRHAGLNRARIRDAVAELSPLRGVTGMIRWDPVGSNTRPVRLGLIRNGRIEPQEASLALRQSKGDDVP